MRATRNYAFAYQAKGMPEDVIRNAEDGFDWYTNPWTKTCNNCPLDDCVMSAGGKAFAGYARKGCPVAIEIVEKGNCNGSKTT